MNMELRDILSNIESIEDDVDKTLEQQERTEHAEKGVRDAISKLSDDVALTEMLKHRSEELEQQHKITDAELESLRQRAENLKEQLEEIVTRNADSAAVLMELQELGEDISDSLSVLEERQKVIDESARQLADVIERLGMDAADFSKGDGRMASLLGGAEAKATSCDDHTLSAHDAFVSQLREIANRQDPIPFNRCCGVQVHGELPEGYEEVVKSRIQNASAQMQLLFARFSGKLVIQNAEYPPRETAHYSPINILGHPRGVYFNATHDQNNVKGAGTTFFHEIGHMIDHANGEFNRFSSNTEELRDALLADGKRAMKSVSGLSDADQQVFYSRLCTDRAHSCSDLLDAVTDGQLCGQYGHSRDYWKRDGHLQEEAFAHFFEASMGDEVKQKLLRQVFPNGYRVFDKMINDLLNPDAIRDRVR